MTNRQKEIYRQLGALFSELAEIETENNHIEPTTPPTEQTAPENDYLPASEFCKRFYVSRSTLWRMTQAGRVQVLDLGGRSRRYRPCEGVKS